MRIEIKDVSFIEVSSRYGDISSMNKYFVSFTFDAKVPGSRDEQIFLLSRDQMRYLQHRINCEIGEE